MFYKMSKNKVLSKNSFLGPFDGIYDNMKMK